MTAGAVRQKETEDDTVPDWLKAGLPDRLDRDLLTRAYRFSEKAHEGQKRLSGERFVSHCVEVAKILVDLQLDSTTVASGLIHDVVEDTNVTVDDIEAEFGKEIAEIVDGLTKIGHLPLNSSQERQVENYRKLLLSIAKDARVILIKLADRLHNMRTLEFLPADRQKRIDMYTEMQNILMEDLPMAILDFPQLPTGVNKRVHNVFPSDINTYWNVHMWWVEE